MAGIGVLALCTFALGADAYLTAGLLAPISARFGSSTAAAGQLVTAFTLAYAVAAPTFAVLLTGPRRTVLACAMAAFVLANAAGALAPSLAVLFVMRIGAGAAAGVLSPLAAGTAAELVPAERRGTALSWVLAGLSAGSVAGVPAGLLLSRHSTWSAAFWLVAGCGAVALAGLLLVLPAGRPARPDVPPPLRARLTVLRDRRVTRVVAATMLQTTASLGAYTYLAAVLATRGIGDPVAHLSVWGAGGLAASLAAGPVSDRLRRPRVLAMLLLGVLAAALVAFAAGAGTPWGLVACGLWGAAGWAFVVPQQHRLLPDTAAVGANSSATYLGAAIGAALGGTAITAGLPVTFLPVAAAALALLGLAVTGATDSRSDPVPVNP
ncbi:MFS transporter [Paractinoplanes ferrugineus]|uniref:MFS transporter n=1 Tax=Paractinoplanes ferrugineus TaxID=113564 RepID=A0A919J1S2_9ACTN|nr:MFS transporter [Actinoplanes ferrugineus]